MSVYIETIVENPRICNRCFRRYKDVEDPPDDDYWREHAIRTTNSHSQDRTLKHIVTRRTVQATTDGVVVNAHPSTTWRSEPENRARPAWVCKACGFIDGRGSPEARTTAEAMAAGKRLVARLDEQAVAVDRDAVLDAIRAGKTDPDTAAKDYAIFERAVTAGIEAAAAQPATDDSPPPATSTAATSTPAGGEPPTQE